MTWVWICLTGLLLIFAYLVYDVGYQTWRHNDPATRARRQLQNAYNQADGVFLAARQAMDAVATHGRLPSTSRDWRNWS
jgi:hypothetical protein